MSFSQMKKDSCQFFRIINFSMLHFLRCAEGQFMLLYTVCTLYMHIGLPDSGILSDIGLQELTETNSSYMCITCEI